MTNKNQYTIGWLGQLAKSGRFCSVRLLLMIPGHTKFSPDEMFARVAHTFYKADVLTEEELRDITSRYSLTYICGGDDRKRWKAVLSPVYKPVPNIKDLHNFVRSASEPGSMPQLRVRKLYSSGEYSGVDTYRSNGPVPDVCASLLSYEAAQECPSIRLKENDL